MNRLEAVLVQLEADLREVGARWALVGGLAVSVRAEPRTTQDIDIGVTVGDDAEAEKVIRDLGDRRYELDMHLKQEAAGRLASVRLLPPADDGSTFDVVVDILFASSGIEHEIVAEADRVEVFPRFGFASVGATGRSPPLPLPLPTPHPLPVVRSGELLTDVQPCLAGNGNFGWDERGGASAVRSPKPN